MPLLLDTPFDFNPGSGQDVETATLVIIEAVHLHLLQPEILLRCQYGNITEDGRWEPIGAAPHMVSIRNEGDDVIWDRNEQGVRVPVTVAHGIKHFDLVRENCLSADAGLSVFDEAKRHLYEYLIANGIYEGAIV